MVIKESDFQVLKKEKEKKKREREKGKRKKKKEKEREKWKKEKKKQRKTRLTLIGGTRKCAYITYVLQPRNIICLSSR